MHNLKTTHKYLSYVQFYALVLVSDVLKEWNHLRVQLVVWLTVQFTAAGNSNQVFPRLCSVFHLTNASSGHELKVESHTKRPAP